MCAVSMVGDYWKDKLPERHPWIFPNSPIVPFNAPTKEEFEALKKEVEHLKELLKAAKIYDEQTNQPDCEMDEKVALIKKIAELVGVDMKEIFKDEAC